jgi:hypothetical protein
MKTYGGGGGVIAPPFLISALDGGEWSVSNPGRSTSEENLPLPIGEEENVHFNETASLLTLQLGFKFSENRMCVYPFRRNQSNTPHFHKRRDDLV